MAEVKPQLLDLFCGAGGCSEGYARAGFEVVGIDIKDQPNYPYEFIKDDALGRLEAMIEAWQTLGDSPFAAIHASPPCQAYSVLRRANPDAVYADLIPETRRLLKMSGLPYVIENVVGAPLREPLVLCGSMFGLEAISGNGETIPVETRQLRRHRLFESNILLPSLECDHKGEALGVYGGGPVGRYTFENGAKKDRYSRRGGYQGTKAEKERAMGIDWMTAGELNQAIPPAYTEHIGTYLMAAVQQKNPVRW